MNKTYEKPEMSIIVFTGEDVITTSGGGIGGSGSDTGGNHDFGGRG